VPWQAPGSKLSPCDAETINVHSGTQICLAMVSSTKWLYTQTPLGLVCEGDLAGSMPLSSQDGAAGSGDIIPGTGRCRLAAEDLDRRLPSNGSLYLFQQWFLFCWTYWLCIRRLTPAEPPSSNPPPYPSKDYDTFEQSLLSPLPGLRDGRTAR
jgi:hypothetical protein